MQVIVLGMHRSGTSAVTRLLNMAGCYFGPEGIATDANEENPKGFWERRDVRQVCDGLLRDSGFDWWKLMGLDAEALDAESRQRHTEEFARIVGDMDAHRPWVLKEPRLCLLLPVLRPVLEVPVCVHVTREPLEVAASLATRNGLPLSVGIALWEVYTRASLRASAGLPRHHVRYEDLMREPVRTVSELVDWLDAEGVQGLRRPSDREITAFIDPQLHRHHADARDERASLNGRQSALSAAIGDGTFFDDGEAHGPPSEGALDVLRAHEAHEAAITELEASHARAEADARVELDEATRALHASQTELDAIRETLDDTKRRSAEALAERDASANAAALEHAMAVRELEEAREAEAAAHREALRQEHDTTGALVRSVVDEISTVEQRLRALERSTVWRVAQRVILARQSLTPGMSRQERSEIERAIARLATARNVLEAHTPPPLDEDSVVEQLPGGITIRCAGPPPPESDRPRVAVLAWDVGHNPLGRAYILAELLGRSFDTEVWGAQFDRYGEQLWAPLRHPNLPVRSFDGQPLPGHLDVMHHVAGRIDADLLWVSKPRFPSYGLGIMAKQARNRPLVLDVDDHERSFFASGALGSVDLASRPATELELPFEEAWTSACEPLIAEADQITVSNAVLQARFGGVIVPHARDERRFDPDAHDRDRMRASLGVRPDDRLLLLGGTPRAHKGVVEVLEALDRLGDPRYRLAVFGTRELHDLRNQIAPFERWLLVLPYRPFDDLAPLVGAADLACVLQDLAHPVSQLQMPAKVTDAMAMRVPCLVSDAPPLRPLVEDDVVHVLRTGDALHERIAAIFDDEEGTRARADRARQRFLDEFSYAAVSAQLTPLFERLLGAEPPPVSPALRDLVTLPRRLLAPAPDAGPEPRPAARAPGSRRWRAAPGEQYDLVMFWKQNDSSIYGRRQDMFLEYLRQSGRFGTIVHFDSPITPERLVALHRAAEGPDQGRLVVRQTLNRVLHRSDRDGVIRRTFLYAGSRSGRLGRPPRRRYPEFVADELRKPGVGKRLTVFWVHPSDSDLPGVIDALQPDLVVADVVDDNRTWYTEGSPHIARIEQNYRDVLERADVVLANCEPVAKAMRELTAEVHVVPNGCELPRAVRSPKPKELAALPGPVIGYVGNLSDRVDIDLVDDIARARPAWQLVLIGSTHLDRSILRLDRHDNVHFLGVRPYAEAQRFVEHFDVALIPHLDNDMTRSMNPLKAFVYASAGVPIVSSPIANVDELEGLITVADGLEEFLAAIEAKLASGRATPDLDVLRAHSWPQRVELVLELIDEAAGARAST
jgi:glycosyltransferase involved in cell wall biosynthesis